MLLFHVLLFIRLRDKVVEGYSDFASFYAAGRIVGAGKGHELYNLNRQFQVQQDFAPGVSIRKGPLPFYHPPFEALLFVPFSLLPYAAAYYLWSALKLGFLWGMSFQWRKHVPRVFQFSALAPVLGVLAFFPAFADLLQGQDAILLLLVYSFVYINLKGRRDFAAGAWLGLGMFKFHLVLPFLAILLLCRRLKAASGFLLAAAAVAAVSIAVAGWQSSLDYPALLFRINQNAGAAGIFPLDMPNLRGLLAGVLGVQTLPSFLGLLALSGLAVVGAAHLWKRPDSGADHLDLAFSLAVVTTVLVGYHTMTYDLSLLILPVLLVTNYGLGDGARLRNHFALIAPVVLLFFPPLYLLLHSRYNRLHLFALVLVLWAVALAREITWNVTAAAGPTPAQP
jgi:hypothetical protein